MAAGKRFDTNDELLAHVQERIIDKYKTYTAFAQKHNVSLQHISNMMMGRRPIPEWVLKAFSIRRIRVTYWETYR